MGPAHFVAGGSGILRPLFSFFYHSVVAVTGTAAVSVEVLPAPENETLGSLVVKYPCIGTFQRQADIVRTAKHIHVPQVFVYTSASGLLVAFEPAALPLKP